MPRTKFKSAEAKRASADHEKWLRSQGIKPAGKKRTPLKGFMPPPDPTYRTPDLPPCSDDPGAFVPTRAGRDLSDPEYQAAVKERAKTVAPSFNKGPLQPQSNGDLFDSRRR